MALDLDLAEFHPLHLDLEPVWHSLGGGAIVAGTLALVRLALELSFRQHERKLESADRRGAFQRDAQARLERELRDRLADADRRLERCELESDAERQRRLELEREHAQLSRSHELLSRRYALLRAEYTLLRARQRLPELPAAERARAETPSELS